MMTLVEWLVAYLKYKDSIHRKVERIEPSGPGNVLVTKKDGSKEEYVCSDSLEPLDASGLEGKKVACLNRKANLDWLVSNWDKLKDRKTTFIFVNIGKAESWSLNTMMHHNVTDKPALKTGLMSLFQTVPEVG